MWLKLKFVYVCCVLFLLGCFVYTVLHMQEISLMGQRTLGKYNELFTSYFSWGMLDCSLFLTPCQRF